MLAPHHQHHNLTLSFLVQFLTSLCRWISLSMNSQDGVDQVGGFDLIWHNGPVQSEQRCASNGTSSLALAIALTPVLLLCASVRTSYSTFLGCYNSGLAKNPEKPERRKR